MSRPVQNQIANPDDDDHPLIVGDYYPGAYGPTVILFLKSTEAAGVLRGKFEEVARGTVQLMTDDSRIRITGLASLTLIRRDDGPEIELRKVSEADPPAFRWTGTEAGWRSMISLIEPFSHGLPGHQYLTREGIDDALVEVSFDERQGEWPPLPAPK